MRLHDVKRLHDVSAHIFTCKFSNKTVYPLSTPTKTVYPPSTPLKNRLPPVHPLTHPWGRRGVDEGWTVFSWKKIGPEFRPCCFLAGFNHGDTIDECDRLRIKHALCRIPVSDFGVALRFNGRHRRRYFPAAVFFAKPFRYPN